MDKIKIWNISKRISTGLIATGFVVAGIGFFCEGLNTISFLLWK